MAEVSLSTAAQIADGPLCCQNCAAALAGRFCASCGQRADVHLPSTHELIHDALEAFTHADSRLWRSLRLLAFHPGTLPLEFFAGRRQAYLSPFRLYLVLSVLCFLAASFSPPFMRGMDVRRDARAQPEDAAAVERQIADNCRHIHFDIGRDSSWDARLAHGCEVTVRDQGAALSREAMHILPRALFVLLPVLALLHKLMYWRPRFAYVCHVVFFLNIEAFIFAVLLLSLLLRAAARHVASLGTLSSIGSDLLWMITPLYLVVAMKRTFKSGWVSAIVKTGVLGVLAGLLFALVIAAVFGFSMAQI